MVVYCWDYDESRMHMSVKGRSGSLSNSRYACTKCVYASLRENWTITDKQQSQAMDSLAKDVRFCIPHL